MGAVLVSFYCAAVSGVAKWPLLGTLIAQTGRNKTWLATPG